MPNWCSSAYTIVGEEKEVEALHGLMEKLEGMREPSVPNGFGTSWLGCLVDALGGDCEKTYCRGSWSDLDLQGGTLTFNTETAWSPCNEVFELVRSKFPSISYYFLAEEGGNGMYQTNDGSGAYYPERFFVELCTPNEDYGQEYFADLPSALHWIGEFGNCEVGSEEVVKRLDELWNDRNENAYCYLHEITIV